MLSIGAKIRSKMHWIEGPIYLIMDNAGGHGTRDAIDEYVDDLATEYNVHIVWQIPRSPETNLLDLGIWNSLQSHVDRVFRGNKQDVQALARTVMTAWESYYTEDVFERVFVRWEKVLRLIIASNGNNSLVDEARGNQVVPIVLPEEAAEPFDASDDAAQS